MTTVRNYGSSGLGRRSCTKLLRLSPEELATLTVRARVSGVPMARYIAERAMLGSSPSLGRAVAVAVDGLSPPELHCSGPGFLDK